MKVVANSIKDNIKRSEEQIRQNNDTMHRLSSIVDSISEKQKQLEEKTSDRLHALEERSKDATDKLQESVQTLREQLLQASCFMSNGVSPEAIVPLEQSSSQGEAAPSTAFTTLAPAEMGDKLELSCPVAQPLAESREGSGSTSRPPVQLQKSTSSLLATSASPEEGSENARSLHATPLPLELSSKNVDLLARAPLPLADSSVTEELLARAPLPFAEGGGTEKLLSRAPLPATQGGERALASLLVNVGEGPPTPPPDPLILDESSEMAGMSPAAEGRLMKSRPAPLESTSNTSPLSSTPTSLLAQPGAVETEITLGEKGRQLLSTILRQESRETMSASSDMVESREASRPGRPLHVGDRVYVKADRKFPTFSSGDKGELVQMDMESRTCEVVFDDHDGVATPVALKHLALEEERVLATVNESEAARGFAIQRLARRPSFEGLYD